MGKYFIHNFVPQVSAEQQVSWLREGYYHTVQHSGGVKDLVRNGKKEERTDHARHFQHFYKGQLMEINV